MRRILIALLLFACDSKDQLPYAGFVDARVSAVSTQIAGKVDAIPVLEGDHVHKGQLLARLESSAQEAAVAQAEANVDRAAQSVKVAEANVTAALPSVTGAGADIARARATRDDAESNYQRIEHLAASGALPQADLDTARARMLEARATVEAMIAARSQTQGRLASANASVNDARAALHAAEAAKHLAEAQLAQTQIVSPFDALVVSRNLEEGEWAAPGTPLVTVEDISRPWVRLDVEERSFAKLRIGQKADVRVIALPGKTLPGHVVQIGAEGDFALDRDVKRGRPDVRTFLVRILFDEVPDQLRPGMTAEVRLLDEMIAQPVAGGMVP